MASSSSSAAAAAAAAALLFLAMLAVAQMAVAHKQIETVNTNRNKDARFYPQACGSACNYRCSQTQYHKPCMKYCNLCCQRCLCVPPGFYDNKEDCPCYNNMKNARGGSMSNTDPSVGNADREKRGTIKVVRIVVRS